LFGLTTSFVVKLDDAASYDHSPSDPVSRGAVWAAALWACRGKLGQQTVDGLVLPAWQQSMSGPRDDDRISEEFGRALVGAPAPVGPCFSKEINERKLPYH